MRIKIRQLAPGFIFTPNHRISLSLSSTQPKSSEIYISETDEVSEYSTCEKISLLDTGVSQLKLVNETITSKAYQDDIKRDIKVQYECTMPQAFNKVTHLANSSLKYSRIHQGPGW